MSGEKTFALAAPRRHHRPGKVANLWFSTGHDTLGWTMACVSGTVIADLVPGPAPAIDARPLGLDRCTAAAASLVPARKEAHA